MPADVSAPRGARSISIIGAGICGAWQALAFTRAGYAVTLHERALDPSAMTDATSHWAGGMLAPWCEAESSEPLIQRLGIRSLALWREAMPLTPFNGSLVVAHPRDRGDLERFARLTGEFQRLDASAVAACEPALAGQFHEALFYPLEGHVEPRRVMPQLHDMIRAAGAAIRFGSEAANDNDLVIDCRGLAARDTLPDLRGVKGEMIVVETREVELSRPVRLIHPRWPLYVIPRGDGRFMIGATTIEREDCTVTVRSALELLGAAYAVHPAFAEAQIVEIGAGLRPAFPDNLPRIDVGPQRISVNGLYRHGFLLAPALAELTLGYVARGEIDTEVMHATRALEVMRCA